MNKPDLALNNLHWFICLKTKPNETKLKFSHKTLFHGNNFHAIFFFSDND